MVEDYLKFRLVMGELLEDKDDVLEAEALNDAVDDDYGAYVESLFNEGLITDEGIPCKCHSCGSKHLEKCNVITDGYNLPAGLIEEYDVCCAECGDIIAHYAYGGWEY